MTSVPVADWAVIAAYFAGMAWIAWFVRRRARTTEGYFVGSRAMRGWAVGFSIAGTAISSITFMALPADAFKTAWLRMLPNFVPLGVLAGSRLFLRIYRDGPTTTAFEFLEARFGASTRIYGAFTFVVGQLLGISLILFLLATMVTGGTIVDASITGPGEEHGPAIRGGTELAIAAGDLISIRPGVPHWVKAVDGRLRYLTVKVHGRPVPAGRAR